LDGRCLPSANPVVDWNEVIVQVMGTNQPPRVPLSRNLAIVHIAMFDAVNAIDRSYEPYAADVHASRGASKVAAASQAARDVMAALYPNPTLVDRFNAELAADLVGIDPNRAAQGIAVGQEVARQILALRANDGAAAIVPWTPPPGNAPGIWEPTWPDFGPATSAHVPHVTPFATSGPEQFFPGPHPTLDSQEYADALNYTKAVGARDAETRDRNEDGEFDRTPYQTQTARLWQTALGNHRAWQRVAQDQALARDLSLPDTARLFALMNMSLHDGLQTSFNSKFEYALWRPITAIWRAGEDNNPDTDAEPPTPGVPNSGWLTLHENTPPYPSYAGNAATIGATCATVLGRVLGADTPITIDWSRIGNFPGVTRSYPTFWAAADEQAISRVYGGIHFTFDSDAGQEIGGGVGNFVVDNYLEPRDVPSAFGSNSGRGGPDELQAAAAASKPVHRALRDARAERLLPAALARWEAAGVDTSALPALDVRVADLGGLTLARAADGVLWVDDDAAGWGWFADKTPRNDSEFTRRGNQGERNRMDLLTVLTHEVGHLLGADHAAGGVMQATLDAGVRWTVGAETTTAGERPGAAPTLFVWNLDAMGLGDLANPFEETE
ncbi:MAG TPA: hypothetical protein VM597_25305, partial [Gemmataceae bacterium]|nr:hypothetical protein [Gemmataceae bacterium]